MQHLTFSPLLLSTTLTLVKNDGIIRHVMCNRVTFPSPATLKKKAALYSAARLLATPRCIVMSGLCPDRVVKWEVFKKRVLRD